MTKDEFVARYGSVYEHAPWVAEKAWGQRGVIAAKMAKIVDAAGHEAQLKLLRAHPDLAGKLALSGTLTAASTSEQASAGLDQCSDAEFAEFTALNDVYKARFGFPFILAVKGKHRPEILETFRSRVRNDAKTEFATALAEVHKIARLRLDPSTK